MKESGASDWGEMCLKNATVFSDERFAWCGGLLSQTQNALAADPQTSILSNLAFSRT